MAVGEGKFLLYSFIDPPLAAGDYRFRTDQLLAASSSGGQADASDLPVATHDTHVRIRAPRYQLPPDQVLSTFPPANTEGAYGRRLPQIVIKRRTLPWERDLAGQPSTTPWLALVLIAEGEAELKLNQPIDQCVTPGTVLGGVADAEVGNYLSIRKSMIDKVFPTRKDVPLLAHARQVDIHDTELMMGDDDGFLAVVISNRLAVAGRDPDGEEVPVKYLACLVNLEGQFDALLPASPPAFKFTVHPVYELEQSVLSVAGWDHAVSGRPVEGTLTGQLVTGGVLDAGGPRAERVAGELPRTTIAGPGGPAAFTASNAWSLEDAVTAGSDVYVQMARPFEVAGRFEFDLDLDVVSIDAVHRFPVLLHWSFISVGDTTFEELMKGLDSGLLGTKPAAGPDGDEPEPPAGRPRLEVVETGHVGLVHRTRRGDEVRSWYRGPFVPHPTEDLPSGRLELAHDADQLRIVIPDGREDLSLASAFEIGRLLALSRPAMVAAVMRWRQIQYQVARRTTIWDGTHGLLDELEIGQLDADVGLLIGRHLVRQVVDRPHDFLGPPRLLHDPGRPLDLDGAVDVLVAGGFGLEPAILSGGPKEVLDGLRRIDVPLVLDVREVLGPQVIRDTLHAGLDRGLVDLVSDTMAPDLIARPIAGPTIPRVERSDRRVHDRLDELLVERDRRDDGDEGRP